MRNFATRSVGGSKARSPRWAQAGRWTRAALIGPFALSMCVGVAEAATITSTGSFVLNNYYAKEELHYMNCTGSSSFCGSYTSAPDYTIGHFSLSIPGVVLPANSKITSASLAYNLPNFARDGVAILQDMQPLDDRQTYSPPTLFASGTLVTLPMSLTAGGLTYEFPFHGSGSKGELDLLATGFGSHILAGDPLTFGARAEATRITWGLRRDDDHPQANSGFNAHSIFLLYVGYPSTNVEATLNVTYESVAVPEPAVWAMMLAGFGAVGASLRAQRRTAGDERAIRPL